MALGTVRAAAVGGPRRRGGSVASVIMMTAVTSSFIPGLLLLVVVPGRKALACTDSDKFACMGNGECMGGVCLCERGWKGPDCAALDLLPVPAAHPGWNEGRPNWGAATLREGDYWYTFVGSKTDLATGASDEFAQNSGLHLLRSESPGGGPFTDLGEQRGLNDQSFGFRVDVKRHPVDGALLLLTEGYAHEPDRGFGFILRRSASGSVMGPWTEHLVYELEERTIDGVSDWTADPTNTDADRWDCRMADPTLAVLASGTVLVGYRGTRCCCNALVGAWSVTGEHEHETAGMLQATSWEGPFSRTGVKIFGDGADVEDMWMWTSDRGVHMLMHSQDNSHYNHEARGAYAFSPDSDGADWRLSPTEAWPTHLSFDDCSSTALVKRQRPSLTFHATTGRPTHLLTGVATSSHGLE